MRRVTVSCSLVILAALVVFIGMLANSSLEYGRAFRELMAASEARGNPLGLLPQGYAAIVENMVKRDRISRAEAALRLAALIRAGSDVPTFDAPTGN